jgi:Protein of unknown function (DUF2955)
MPIGARRTFRFAAVVALSLVFAYGLRMPLPFLAPLFAVLLTATPAPPPGLKGLLGLIVVVLVTTGVGLLLIPFLRDYALSAVLIIAAGLYLSVFVSVGRGKALVGTLLTAGLTLIPAAGLIEYSLAAAVVDALALGIALAIVCQWIVYPFFPEDSGRGSPSPPPPAAVGDARWIALRATLIVLPPLLVTFSNPTLYLPTIMKTVLLGQQGSVVSAREAGRELLGSTFLAGCLAMVFWFALQIQPSLWMFFLWMLLSGVYFGGKLCGVIATRFASSFWINVVVTMLILLGPAVQDSVVGNDVYRGFAVRFSLFVAVTLYAWVAIVALERMRAGGLGGSRILSSGT